MISLPHLQSHGTHRAPVKRARDETDHVRDVRPLSGIPIVQNATVTSGVLKKVKRGRDGAWYACDDVRVLLVFAIR